MDVLKISAFSHENQGGNPAGVVFLDTMPSDKEMQDCAADVGFSETVFAVSNKEDEYDWRVRYFSPEIEVPFCGHATIALGAALAERVGTGLFHLNLNEAKITVKGTKQQNAFSAELKSPNTNSKVLEEDEIAAVTNLFGYKFDELDLTIPPALIHGGANHYVFALKNRDALAKMEYDLSAGRVFMLSRNLVTVMVVWQQDQTLFHVRNAFASGGVLEDPATGAAAAAFAGYLRDMSWSNLDDLKILQGEDMRAKSQIHMDASSPKGQAVLVSGAAYKL